MLISVGWMQLLIISILKHKRSILKHKIVKQKQVHLTMAEGGAAATGARAAVCVLSLSGPLIPPPPPPGSPALIVGAMIGPVTPNTKVLDFTMSALQCIDAI
jgi:hypothetical protein